MTFPSSFSAAHHCDCHSKGFSGSYAFSSRQSSSLEYSNNENGQSFSYSQNSSVSYRVEISSHSGGDTGKQLVYSKEQSSSFSLASQPATSQLGQSEASKAVDKAEMTEGAKNILGFIENRLAKEKAAGASEEELNELLEQGMAGFKQGYGEAMEILGEKGFLSDEVDASVGQLYDEVNDGFAAMRETYTGAKTDKAEAVDNAVPAGNIQSIQSGSESSRIMRLSSGSLSGEAEALTNRQPIKSFVEDLPEVKAPEEPEAEIDVDKALAKAPTTDAPDFAPGTFVQTEVEYGRLDKFSFALETTDGDKVVINALNTSVFAAKYEGGNDQGNIYEDMVAATDSKQSYDFDVQGDLDEAEMSAIKDLMGQVMNLADEFYNGDVEKAYAQAAEIGFDTNEITGYSLDMKQLEQYQVATTTYRDIAPQSPASQPLDIIGNYAENVLAALESPDNNSRFDFGQMLDLLSKQVDEQVESDAPVGFNDSVKSVMAAQEEGKDAA